MNAAINSFLSFASLVFLFCPQSVFALSVREEALRENQTINEKSYRKTIHASEAQQAKVESFLKLEDPSLELRDRPWLWSFAFKVQTLQPRGTGKIATSFFDLSTYGSGIMSSIELGVLLPVIDRPWIGWSSGLAAHAGVASQSTRLQATSGYVYNDARLNTVLLSGIWNHRFTTRGLPRWTLLFTPEVGVLNYTQTAAGSDLANFSQENSFWGVGLGAEYSFNKKWGLVAEYKHRAAGDRNSTQTNLQPDNFEIGTAVVW